LEEKTEEVLKKISLFNSKTLKNKIVNLSQPAHKMVFCIFDINVETKKVRLKSKISE